MNKKILIVDDDFSLRTVMLKALSSKSVDVKSVSSVSGPGSLSKRNF